MGSCLTKNYLSWLKPYHAVPIGTSTEMHEFIVPNRDYDDDGGDGGDGADVITDLEMQSVYMPNWTD